MTLGYDMSGLAGVDRNSDVDSNAVDGILDDIECVACSKNRLKILHQLLKSPQSASALNKAVSIHRTSLRRNLDVLMNKNWVRSDPAENVFRISPSGQIFLEGFYEMMETTRTAADIGSFLGQFPEPTPVSVDALRECSITVSETRNPHAPLNRSLELIGDSDVFRGFVPVVNSMYLETLSERVRDDSDFEVISEPSMVDTLQSRHPSKVQRLQRADTGELFVSSEIPDYGLCVLDDTVLVIVYDDSMKVSAILESSDEGSEIFEWAAQRYEACSQTAKEYGGERNE